MTSNDTAATVVATPLPPTRVRTLRAPECRIVP